MEDAEGQHLPLRMHSLFATARRCTKIIREFSFTHIASFQGVRFVKRGLQQARRWKHIHAVSLLLANFAALALVVQGCQERNHLTQDAGQMRAAYVQKEKKKGRPHVPFTAACEWQRWEAACRQLCPRQVAAQFFEGCASAVSEAELAATSALAPLRALATSARCSSKYCTTFEPEAAHSATRCRCSQVALSLPLLAAAQSGVTPS